MSPSAIDIERLNPIIRENLAAQHIYCCKIPMHPSDETHLSEQLLTGVSARSKTDRRSRGKHSRNCVKDLSVF